MRAAWVVTYPKATRTASAASAVGGVRAASAARIGAAPCSYKRSLSGRTQAEAAALPAPKTALPTPQSYS